MENINPDYLPEKFSEDPQENLRIENEILKLTINAELGGKLMRNTQLPPEVENEFLKHVLAFEHAFADAHEIKVYDLLSRPAFRKAIELKKEELPGALEALTALLEKNNIVIEFLADYDDYVKYSFITDELFEHEMSNVQIPGMMTHFCYEEFHPNHKLEIEERAKDFIISWFKHNTDKYDWILADRFILPGGKTLQKDAVIDKITKAHEAYPVFESYNYDLDSIHFEFADGSEMGLGHADGTVKYTVLLESFEHVEIAGTFKIFLSSKFGCWEIIYFEFPGFSWD